MPVDEPIARPGRNCWRIVHAERLAFLVDAAEYFSVLAESIARTRRSILLVGWDVHSRVALRRSTEDQGPTLAEALDAAARAHRRLRAYLLDWDYAPVYALDREWLPSLQFRRRTHRRVRFRLDGEHPLGASHHQKIVVCDDRLAFIGGIDVAPTRWDTREHRVEHPLRRTPSGHPFGPFHDVQVAVSGEAAAALGEICRERWRRATGRTPRVSKWRSDAEPWPENLEADVRDVQVALARTEAAWDGRPAVREVENFLVDAIAVARDSIYLENQYLSSAAIGDALCRRLAEPDGPDVVILGPQRCEGWLEDATMGALRARLLVKLREADVGGRLRVWAPLTGGPEGDGIIVHAKVSVIDDRAVRVGSANLNNRSMGLDTECDLWLEARGREDVRQAIARFRNGLLAEHLGIEIDRVQGALDRSGSLSCAVDELRSGARDRVLTPIDGEIGPWAESLVPDSDVVDPEEPVELERLTEELELSSSSSPGTTMMRIAVTCLGVIVLAVLWRWTPIADALDAETVAKTFEGYRHGVTAPVVALVGFTAASLLAAPVTVLTVLVGLVFGPWVGFASAAVGSLLSASIAFAFGRYVFGAAVERSGSSWLAKVNDRLRDKGLYSMVILRLVPVAPFTVVNLVAGASRVSYRHFVIGTALVMVPGAMLLTIFAESSRELLRDPDPESALVAIGVGVGIVALSVWVRRRVQARARRRN